MHKKGVLAVGPSVLYVMAEPRYVNNAFAVRDAIEHLFGNLPTTASHAVSIGSGYGLARVTLSDYLVNSPATAPLNLMESRITGLNKAQRSKLITLLYATLFLMLPIFIRMVVS